MFCCVLLFVEISTGKTGKEFKPKIIIIIIVVVVVVVVKNSPR
jgi:t-SNARE complex subunit (syntaxin)